MTIASSPPTESPARTILSLSILRSSALLMMYSVAEIQSSDGAGNGNSGALEKLTNTDIYGAYKRYSTEATVMPL